MWWRVIEAVGRTTAVLLLIICNSGRAQAAEKVEYKRLKAWRTAGTAEERAYVTETYTIFRIIEPKYAKDQLKNSADYGDFRHLVENEWKPGHVQRWSEVLEILDFCRQEGLGTALDDVEPDSRWELFLRYGKPRYNMPFPIPCGGGDDECMSWNYTFDPGEEGDSPVAASCVARPGISYPTEIVDTEEQILPFAQPIYPSVTYSRFYGDWANGDVDLWFSIWSAADQFTGATVDQGILTARVELWDTTKSTLIDDYESIRSLDAIRGTLKAMQDDARAKLRVMQYVHFRVRPGTYRARVRVIGADKYNEGGSWYEDPIVVPAESDMSDLLVIAPNLVEGIDVEQCIQRGSELYLCNYPQGRILETRSLNLYTEFKLPQGSQNITQFVAKVTLRPLPEISDPSAERGRVQVGQGFVQQFDGRPFLGGQSQQDWEEAVQEFFGDVEEEEIMLLEQAIGIDDPQSIQRLNLSCELQDVTTGEKIKKGKYLLTVRIEGCGFACSPAVSRTVYVVQRD